MNNFVKLTYYVEICKITMSLCKLILLGFMLHLLVPGLLMYYWCTQPNITTYILCTAVNFSSMFICCIICKLFIFIHYTVDPYCLSDHIYSAFNRIMGQCQNFNSISYFWNFPFNFFYSLFLLENYSNKKVSQNAQLCTVEHYKDITVIW